MVPLLIKLLEREPEPTRLDVTQALEQIGAPAAPAIPYLIHAMHDQNGDVANWVPSALHGIGVAAVDPLISALTDRDADFRRMAAFTLSLFGRDATRAIPALVHGLGSWTDHGANCEFHTCAGNALATMGPQATAPLMELIAGTKDILVAREGGYVLNEIDPDNYKPIKSLIGNSDPESMVTLLVALAEFGSAALGAQDTVRNLLTSPDTPKAVKLEALNTLANIGLPDVISLKINEAMALDDVDFQWAAVNAIEKLFYHSPELVQTLLAKAAQSRYAAVRLKGHPRPWSRFLRPDGDR